ncbi:hypothetical protein K370107A2_11940 [Merdimmobilis hominis]|uniref:Cyclic lactone autoinducer peptide n=1 Tax=uncultured Anaerotruncus sp. TaxID=905011 RepID=A0A6N2S4U9_9FIRM
MKLFAKTLKKTAEKIAEASVNTACVPLVIYQPKMPKQLMKDKKEEK